MLNMIMCERVLLYSHLYFRGLKKGQEVLPLFGLHKCVWQKIGITKMEVLVSQLPWANEIVSNLTQNKAQFCNCNGCLIREQKLNLNFFFSNFSGTSGKIPAKSRDIPPKKFDFPGFEGHTELFGPHPFVWKTPTPPENIRAQRFRFGFVFSCLTNSTEIQNCNCSRSRCFSSPLGSPPRAVTVTVINSGQGRNCNCNP